MSETAQAAMARVTQTRAWRLLSELQRFERTVTEASGALLAQAEKELHRDEHAVTLVRHVCSFVAATVRASERARAYLSKRLESGR